jgi:serine/threonine-protein kinase
MLSKYSEDRPQSVEAVVSELLPMVEDQKTQIKVVPEKKERSVEVVEQIKYQRANWLTILCGVMLIMSLVLNGLLLSDQGLIVKEWLLEYILKFYSNV